MMESGENKPPIEREPTIFNIETASTKTAADYRLRSGEPSEDNGFILPSGLAAGVFDGMGGHKGGGDASDSASKTVEHEVQALTNKDTVESTTIVFEQALTKAHEVICKKILENVSSDPTDHMGTTGVIAGIVEHGSETTAVISWVGDSRAILIRNGVAITLTLDDAGWLRPIPPDQRARQQEIQSTAESVSDMPDDASPRRLVKDSSITQHLGKLKMIGGQYIADTIKVHTVTHVLQDGDILLLCTDGITDPITLPRIAEIASTHSVKDLAQALIEEARARHLAKHNRRKDDDKLINALKCTLG